MRPRRSPSASSTPPPSCGSCAPARSRSTSTARRCSSSHRSRSPTRSSCSPVAPRRGATTKRSPHADDAVQELCRSLDGLPLAIELAAARTKTLSIEEITRRLDDRFNVLRDPTSREPERRRALKATIGWSYELLFPDDQRGLWALAAFAGGAPLPAVEFVLEALDVPASAAIDVVGRLASRSLVIVDDEGASPPVRYRLLDSIRAFALEAMTDARLTERALAAHAAWFADAAAIVDTGCAQRPPSRAPLVRPSRARQHRRRAGVERRARTAARARHRQRVRLGVGRARRQPRRATDPGRARRGRRRGSRPGPRRRPAARGVDRSVDRSTSSSPATTSPRATELADAIDDVDLQARCSYYLAYVVSHHGEFRAGAGADRSQRRALRGPGPAVGPGRELALRRPGRDLRRRRGAQRRSARSGRALARRWSTTRGSTSAATRCSASWPASSTGSTTPSSTSVVPRRRRAGSASCRRRRTRSRVSDGRSARPATTRPAPPRSSSRSRRPRPPATCALAALARVHLGRVLRALGQTRASAGRARDRDRVAPRRRRWRAGRARRVPARGDGRRGSGRRRRGAPRRDPRRGAARTTTPTSRSSRSTRSPASPPRPATSPPRSDLCAEADRRMEAASHFITERDRTDADSVRQIA